MVPFAGYATRKGLQAMGVPKPLAAAAGLCVSVALLDPTSVLIDGADAASSGADAIGSFGSGGGTADAVFSGGYSSWDTPYGCSDPQVYSYPETAYGCSDPQYSYSDPQTYGYSPQGGYYQYSAPQTQPGFPYAQAAGNLAGAMRPPRRPSHVGHPSGGVQRPPRVPPHSNPHAQRPPQNQGFRSGGGVQYSGRVYPHAPRGQSGQPIVSSRAPPYAQQYPQNQGVPYPRGMASGGRAVNVAGGQFRPAAGGGVRYQTQSQPHQGGNPSRNGQVQTPGGAQGSYYVSPNPYQAPPVHTYYQYPPPGCSTKFRPPRKSKY